MREITVTLQNHSYPIRIERGLFAHAADFLPSGKAAVITDENVNRYYGDIFPGLPKLVLPAGEETKSPEYLLQCYAFLLENGITRKDCVIALGGGVIGDLVGFAAATLLRGIPYIQIPTTLLAQVDSSVGGKTAIDLPEGKNLAGAFYHPQAVLIDPNCLSTLPPRQVACGMAEVIKYGCILDEPLLTALEEGSIDEEEIIYRCCNWKREVVEEDPEDRGRRMILNFGHTYGHCAERAFGYSGITHGEGVAAGMVRFARLGEELGLSEAGTENRIRALCKKYDLPEKIAVSKEVLRGTLVHDKKGEHGDINIVLLRKAGESFLHKLPKTELLALLEKEVSA